MRIIRAEHLGMCFGVRDAIALARAEAQNGPLSILGELVHNETVLESLRKEGVAIEADPAKVQTRRAMVTAHGASEKAMQKARGHGLELLEGTCPLVHHAHRAVRELVSQGYHPVVIGKRDHVEVRGLTEDLEEYDVVLSEEEVAGLKERRRFGVAAQTTQPIERVRKLAACLRERFPQSEVRFIDSVCLPTKQRQRAARDLAESCSVVVVVGGAGSNNTRELVKTCAARGAQVYHVQQANDLRAEWFQDEDVVGLTAGTSTPDEVINEVEKRLRAMAAEAVAESVR